MGTASPRPSALVFRLLLAVVVLAPLPLGSNRPWAWSLLATLVGVLLGAWGVLVLTGRARAPVPISRLLPMAVPFGLALLWGAAQASGLSAIGAHPVWREAALALAGEPAVVAIRESVSVDPMLSWTAVMRLAAYAGVFWLAVQLGRDRDRAREGLVTIAAAAVAYGVYGLVAYFSETETILWMAKWAYLGDLTATFVNRNAYGAHAGIGLLCCLVLSMHTLTRSAGHKAKLSDIVETLLTEGYPLAIGAVILSTTLLLSHSRGAWLSTGIGVVVLLVALAAARMASPRHMAMMGLTVILFGLAVTAVSGDVTINRLEDINDYRDDRPELFRITLGAIGAAPLTGHGVGTFEPAFAIHRDAALPAPFGYDFAHNTWLEAAMDLGLPGAVLLLGGPIMACVACARGLRRRRRDRIYPAVALAVAVQLGAHAMVDFTVQMPAIAATLALLLGLGVAQSWNSEREGRDSHPPSSS